jgi:hypothetical protein
VLASSPLSFSSISDPEGNGPAVKQLNFEAVSQLISAAVNQLISSNHPSADFCSCQSADFRQPSIS